MDGPDSPYFDATDLRLTNASDTPCFLSGWAGMTVFGSEPDEQPMALRTERLDAPVDVVTLEPGEWTEFSVRYSMIFCLKPVSRLEVRLPDDIAHPIVLTPPRMCTDEGVQLTPFGRVAHTYDDQYSR